MTIKKDRAGMRACGLAFAAVLALFSNPAVAATVQFGGVMLDLPAQFSGPVRATPDADSETIAYSSAHERDGQGNVVQLTRYDFGQKLPANLTDSQLAEGTSKYLLQMLDAVHRRRFDYVQSPPEPIRLAGRVAARANWSGTLQGFQTNGVMYCVIVGSEVLIIHAFGPGTQPNEELRSALRDIERARRKSENEAATSAR